MRKLWRKPLLTIEEACWVLSISRASLMKLMEGERIRGFKVGPGCCYRVDPDSVEAWLRKCRVKAPPAPPMPRFTTKAEDDQFQRDCEAGLYDDEIEKMKRGRKCKKTKAA